MLNTENYNNSFWDYVNILNSSNNSVFFFFVILMFFLNSKFFKKNINFKKINVFLINFFNFIVLIKTIKLKKLVFLTKQLNLNLINGLIIIHPIFMYITYSLFALNFLNFNFFKKKNWNLRNFNNFKKKSILCSFFALILGSYWAQQEINWGGWWNWDFVEMVSLIFFLKSVYFIHINTSKNLNIVYNISTNVFVYLLLFFILIRVDILNSIHSFNSVSLISFSLNFLIYIYILYIFFILLYKIKNIYKYNNSKKLIISDMISLIISFLLIYIYYNVYISYIYNIQLIELTKYLKNLFLFLIFLFIFINLFFPKFLFYLIFIFFIPNSWFNIYIIFFISIYYLIWILNKFKLNSKNYYHSLSLIFLIFLSIKSNLSQTNYYVYLNYILYNLNIHNNLFVLSINEQSSFIDNTIFSNLLNNMFFFNSNFFYNSFFNEVLISNILTYKNILYIIYDIESTLLNVNHNILFYFLYLIFIYIFIKNVFFLKNVFNENVNKSFIISI